MKSKKVTLLSKYYFLVLIFFMEFGLTQNTPPTLKGEFNKFLFSDFEITQDSLFDKYDITKYHIQIIIQPDGKEITGKVVITFNVLENNFENLKLDLSYMIVDSTLHGNDKTNFTHQNDDLNIQLKSTLYAGSVDSVIVFYHGKPTRGLYFRENKFSESVIYTHNEPYDAHYWFPCKDIPSDKAILEMSVTMPNAYKILSNGQLINIQSIGTESIQYLWRESYPISTYLVSIAASKFDVVSDTFNWQQFNMPVEYYLYPQDKLRGEAAINNTIEMLDFFSNYIGTYPFIDEKYAMSEVPFQEAGAMENQTATTMGDFIMDNENVIAHELAHQWWGDALSPTSFKDIWLNEGFATYFDALFTEHKYGKSAFLERMTAFSSNVFSDGSINYPIFDPPLQFLFGSVVYHKGAWVLHMLRNDLGDTVFRNIINTYYDNYKYENVSTDDFINTCEFVSGRSLQTFFKQWVFSPGIPRIFATWQQKDGQINIILEQLQQETIYNLNLEILLNGLKRDTLFNLNFASQKMEYKILFSDEVLSMQIDPNKKILNLNNGPVYLIPANSKLIQVFPNPFNNELNIYYSVDRPQKIEIEIWNILGEKVGTIFSGYKKIGTYKFIWQSVNLSTGQYYCVLRSEDGTDNRKIILIK